jgi:hypothetical protein
VRRHKGLETAEGLLASQHMQYDYAATTDLSLRDVLLMRIE